MFLIIFSKFVRSVWILSSLYSSEKRDDFNCRDTLGGGISPALLKIIPFLSKHTIPPKSLSASATVWNETTLTTGGVGGAEMFSNTNLKQEISSVTISELF